MNSLYQFYRVGFLVVCLLSTAACSSMKKTEEESAEIKQTAQNAISAAKSDLQDNKIAMVSEIPSSYLGSRFPVQLKERKGKLPVQIDSPIELNFVESTSMKHFGELIAKQTGLGVEVSPDIETKLVDNLNWSGSVRSLLEHVAAQQGVFWKWQKSTIHIYQTELRFWTIYASGVNTKWTSNIGLSGAVSGSGSDLTSTDSVSVTTDDANFWTETLETIESLLSPQGKATLSPQSGSLAVTDTPIALDRIGKWIARKNLQLATQILVQIDLYEIEHSESGDQGISIEGLLESAIKQGKLTTTTTNNDDESIVSFKYSNSFTNRNTNITAALRSSVGNNQITKLTSSLVRGINGQPVPVFFGDETSYLQRREVVYTDGSASVRLVPGKIQDGIALNLMTRVLPGTNQLILHATLRTTRIKAINRFPANAGPNDPVIQLPDLESRSMLIPVLLRSGETLIVAGLDTTRSNARKIKGLLTRNSRTSNKRASLVLLITPQIITPDVEITRSQV